MGPKKMTNATRHRRLAWIGGSSLVVVLVVAAICSPEAFLGQVSLGSLVRELVTIVLAILAITVMNRKRRDKDLSD